MRRCGDLLTALTDESWQVRRATARALGKLPGQATGYALRMALEDPIWQVGVESLTSLGKISADVDRRALSLLHDEIPEVRTAAATAVGQSNDPLLIPDLGALLRDPDKSNPPLDRPPAGCCRRNQLALTREQTYRADGAAFAGPRSRTSAGHRRCPSVQFSPPSPAQVLVSPFETHLRAYLDLDHSPLMDSDGYRAEP